MRSKIERYVLPVFLLVVAAASLACGKAERGASRTIKDGVEIVENGGGIHAVKGEPKALTLREEFRIDTEDDSVAAAGLTNIENLDADSQGRILLFRRSATSGIRKILADYPAVDVPAGFHDEILHGLPHVAGYLAT